MAPEQAAGDRVDGRADLFSLGCVFFEMASGTRAFQGDTLTAIMFALANHTPPPAHTLNPAVPEALSQLIQRLLEKKREDRPASAAEVATLLKAMETAPAAVVAVKTGEAKPKELETITHEPPKKTSRRAWLIGGAVMAALIPALLVSRPLFLDQPPNAVVSRPLLLDQPPSVADTGGGDKKALPPTVPERVAPVRSTSTSKSEFRVLNVEMWK